MGLQIRRFVQERHNIGKKHLGGEDFSLSPPAYERGYYQNLLTLAGGNVSEAARQAGLQDSTLRKKLKKMGINSE